jgi:hypothetical protein
MNIKIIQADTRPIRLYIESRNLVYGATDHINFDYVARLNNNILLQPNDAISLARMVNLLKSNMISVKYEFIHGNKDDWESEGKKAHCWIKIDALIKQIKDPQNKDIEVFCFMDSDAWIRDEGAFLGFCRDFLASPYSMAAPRDLDMPGASYLNAGFCAVKNTNQGLQIMETIYNHPDYREHDTKCWHEGSEISHYQEEHPDEVMVLPLNDFNTPCGRIVRHCWTKHLIEPFVLEELTATMGKFFLNLAQNPNHRIGGPVLLLPSSS